MASVSGFENDVFISYAHTDNLPLKTGEPGWIDEFHRCLARALTQHFGRPDAVKIWHDPVLRGNQVLPPSVMEACLGSAVLLCVTSPGYMKSRWCSDEYRCFRSGLPADYATKLGNLSPVINVRCLPTGSEHELTYHERFGDMLGFCFFDEETAMEIWPTTQGASEQRYWRRIKDLARSILDVLERRREMSPRPKAELSASTTCPRI